MTDLIQGDFNPDLPPPNAKDSKKKDKSQSAPPIVTSEDDEGEVKIDLDSPPPSGQKMKKPQKKVIELFFPSIILLSIRLIHALSGSSGTKKDEDLNLVLRNAVSGVVFLVVVDATDVTLVGHGKGFWYVIDWSLLMPSLT